MKIPLVPWMMGALSAMSLGAQRILYKTFHLPVDVTVEPGCCCFVYNVLRENILFLDNENHDEQPTKYLFLTVADVRGPFLENGKRWDLWTREDKEWVHLDTWKHMNHTLPFLPLPICPCKKKSSSPTKLTFMDRSGLFHQARCVEPPEGLLAFSLPVEGDSPFLNGRSIPSFCMVFPNRIHLRCRRFSDQKNKNETETTLSPFFDDFAIFNPYVLYDSG